MVEGQKNGNRKTRFKNGQITAIQVKTAGGITYQVMCKREEFPMRG